MASQVDYIDDNQDIDWRIIGEASVIFCSACVYIGSVDDLGIVEIEIDSTHEIHLKIKLCNKKTKTFHYLCYPFLFLNVLSVQVFHSL